MGWAKGSFIGRSQKTVRFGLIGINSSVYIAPFRRFAPIRARTPKDRWPSGLRRTPGTRVYVKAYRGFESLPVRHFAFPLASPADMPRVNRVRHVQNWRFFTTLLHGVFARLGLGFCQTKNRGKTGARTFGEVEDHQIRLFQPGRREAQDLLQEWRGAPVRGRALFGSPCDDGGAVPRTLLSRPDQDAVSQTGCLKPAGAAGNCVGLRWGRWILTAG
jgi:hypothetical protein